MNQRSAAAEPTALFGLFLLAVTLALSPSVLAGEPAPKDKADDVFGLNRVLKLHLQLSAENWQAMQPKGGFRAPFGAPPAPKNEDKDKPSADIHRSAFGMEFPYVKADLEVQGETLKDVGARFKGNFSYSTSAGRLKRPFKLDLNRHVSGQNYHGQKELNLSNGAADPTQARETLAFRTFALAGVPSPRTAFAELYLTIPGKYDRAYVGIYTMIENVDKTFLKRHFGSSKGLLLKPEMVRELDYLGESWEPYARRYRPKTDVKVKHSARLIALAKLVHKADDAQFRKDIAAYLDVDEFLRFLAATTLLSSMDSFFGIGHNYFLYLRPDTNRFVFLPWDEDHAFGGMTMMGQGDQLAQLSLMHPHGGQNRLIERVLAMPEHAKDYKEHCRRLIAAMKEHLPRELPLVEAAIKEARARETKASADRKEGQGFGKGGFGPPMGGTPDLRKFLAEREKSVLAQLDGDSQGYVPKGFGGPPGGKGGPGGFGPGMFFAKPVLDAADTNKDGKLSKEEFVAAAERFFKACDPDNKGTIDEKTVSAGLNRLLPPPPGFGKGPGPGRPGGGPGGGPGTFLAASIIKKAGADKEGKVTQAKFAKAAEGYFQECDKDKNGSLDEKEIGAGINLLFPPPPGFGPAGGGFGGGPPQPPRPSDARKEEGRP